MPAPRFVRHLTLDTGDQRDSYRDEVADDVVELLRPLLERAVGGERVAVPGAVEPAGCTMVGSRIRGGGLLVTVYGPEPSRHPLVTFGVAPTSLASATLWRAGVSAETPPPRPPWCAVRLGPGLALHPEAARWLGDFERCCAWAWVGG